MRSVPAGWDLLRVSEVGEVKLGRQRSPEHASGPHMRPYLRVANVFDGRIDYSDVLEMNFSPNEFDAYSLKPGDILLNEGQSLELVGRSALYDGPPGICFQNTLIRFRSYRAIPGFARAVFKHWMDCGEFRKIAKQTTSIAHLGADRFAKMGFPLPPMCEQRRIVEILDAVDLKINSIDRQVDKGGLIRRGILDRLISELSGSSVSLIDLALKESGSTVIGPFGSDLTAGDYRPSGIPVVFVRDVHADGFRWVSNVYVDSTKARALSAHQVRAQDVVLTKMGLPPCVAAVYPDDMADGIITADIVRLRPNVRIVNPHWLALAINHGIVRSQVRAITGGITRPKVTLTDVRNIRIDLPLLDEQNRIVKIVAAHDARLTNSMGMRQKLSELRRGLIDDLLTGRVRVKDIENTL